LKARLAILVAAGCICTPAVSSVLAAAPAVAAGHYANLRGIRVYYEIHGHGRPLFLLHGGAGDGRQFSHQVPEFQKTFEVIVPDACAQGRTSDRPGPLTYHEMAEDVIALMDHLKIPRTDVMGWSDGGVVGLDLAIHHSDRIAHVVTFGANFHSGGLKAPDRAWALTATADSFGQESEAAYGELSPEPRHWREAMTKIIGLWRDQPTFTLAELRGIRTRVMIAAGEDDVVERAHTDSLARAIPGAREWIVPKASHSAMMEQPELVNRTVLAFLNDRPLP
jgi:pimeloyl-ACP methyl ester carboxylesterase